MFQEFSQQQQKKKKHQCLEPWLHSSYRESGKWHVCTELTNMLTCTGSSENDLTTLTDCFHLIHENGISWVSNRCKWRFLVEDFAASNGIFAGELVNYHERDWLMKHKTFCSINIWFMPDYQSEKAGTCDIHRGPRSLYLLHMSWL